MRLEQLQAFLAIADTGSFQQAAKVCNLNQSTVSRQVQALEMMVGGALFHRGSQAKLTLAGEKLLPHARKICQSWLTATTEISALQAGKQTELCVAGVPSACAYQLPPVLQQFTQNYPQVQLRVTTLGSDRALKVLRDGLVDIAIVMRNSFLNSSQEMVVDHLYEESVELLLAADHPLAQRDHLSWQDLDDVPQAVFKDGYGLQRLVTSRFQQLKLRLNAVVELNALDAFRGVVAQGRVVALLPQTFLDTLRDDPKLVVRPIYPQIVRSIVLVTTTDRLQIPPIRHFCELARNLITSANGLDSGLVSMSDQQNLEKQLLEKQLLENNGMERQGLGANLAEVEVLARSYFVS
ncbi:MAG: LysR family transcriptional regulator [Pseudanabaenaceae cyanobacterium]|jgi:DNA-binding transcriptional LysR family regulator